MHWNIGVQKLKHSKIKKNVILLRRFITSMNSGSYHRDKYGRMCRIHIEDCTDNHNDWDEYSEVLGKSFVNEHVYTKWFPQKSTRSKYIQAYTKWDFKKDNADLFCIKAEPIEELGRRTIIICGAVAYRHNGPISTKIDFSQLNLPSFYSNKVKRSVMWEANILDSVSEVTRSLQRHLVYITNVTIHPDFRGVGAANLYLTRLLKSMAAKKNIANINADKKNKSQPVFLGLATNKKTLDFIKTLGFSNLSHLHFPQPEGTIICQEENPESKIQSCVYVVVNQPNDNVVLEKLKQLFKHKSFTHD